jgi:16S rRNA (adenine1518-N6/adenine1519-N6)-dimethyltransferase
VVELSIHTTAFDVMILMFQKEVAQRIRAAADSDHYGLLSVVAQTFWEIETVCEAGPRDFFPPPKVASRVLKFSRRAAPPVTNKTGFLQFLKAAFSQRRKQMAKPLLHSGVFSDPESLKRAWAVMNLRSDARAEQLTVAQFHQLFHLAQGKTDVGVE